jgi:hypothetical protein
MPISFDPDSDQSDFGFDEAEDTSQSADDFVESLEQDEGALDEQMSEVELRLEKASYYRLLLKNNPFDSDSAVADEVWRDLTKIIRSRLSELLGMSSPAKAQPVVAPPFNSEEITVLKSIAAKVMGKPAILDKPQPKKQPTLKKVEVKEEKPIKLSLERQTVRKVRDTVAPNPDRTVKPGPGRKKKVFREVVNEQGKTVKMDITPQTKPEGRVQPLATPSVELGNAVATEQAAKIAAKNEAIISLVQAQGD